MENNTEFEVAEHILQTCFWNNTNYTAQYILDHIDEKNFSRKIFSAIIENSKALSYDLQIIKNEYVKDFLLEWDKKTFVFNAKKTMSRIDALINLYIDSSRQLRHRKWK